MFNTECVVLCFNEEGERRENYVDEYKHKQYRK